MSRQTSEFDAFINNVNLFAYKKSPGWKGYVKSINLHDKSASSRTVGIFLRFLGELDDCVLISSVVCARSPEDLSDLPKASLEKLLVIGYFEKTKSFAEKGWVRRFRYQKLDDMYQNQTDGLHKFLDSFRLVPNIIPLTEIDRKDLHEFLVFSLDYYFQFNTSGLFIYKSGVVFYPHDDVGFGAIDTLLNTETKSLVKNFFNVFKKKEFSIVKK